MTSKSGTQLCYSLPESPQGPTNTHSLPWSPRPPGHSGCVPTSLPCLPTSPVTTPVLSPPRASALSLCPECSRLALTHWLPLQTPETRPLTTNLKHPPSRGTRWPCPAAFREPPESASLLGLFLPLSPQITALKTGAALSTAVSGCGTVQGAPDVSVDQVTKRYSNRPGEKGSGLAVQGPWLKACPTGISYLASGVTFHRVGCTGAAHECRPWSSQGSRQT